ncbi:PIG-L family deacetylase [Pseudomonas solani]|uniref:PIG-L deacetylase family protein n=1 Tax=Pseudomonas solani TaxID=2731552 RepID=UPI0035BE1905
MRAHLIHGDGTPLQAWNASHHLGLVPSIDCERLVPPEARAVIVAPHPDDEVLGCGGLLQLLFQLGRQVLLISVTDGSASHPGSPYWTAHRLGIVRPQESAEALHRLGIPVAELKWLRGGFPDTGVERHLGELKRFLTTYLQPSNVVFTTWREDGHADHEAVGLATLEAGMEVGALVHEVPIWAWHWAAPEDPRIPWERARKVELDNWTLARKRHAVQAFASQLYADPDGGQPVLTPASLERLQQPFELVFL